MLYIGTSGYDYDDWTGAFYHAALKKADRLSYYAQHFNALELNNSYYRIPNAPHLLRMAERTDRKLKFTIKAYKGITHDIIPDLLEKTAAEFIAALEPLLKDNLLLCVLLQFPQSFHYDTVERVYLDKVLKLFANIPVIVEMRNVKWQHDNVYTELKKRNVGWCITDNPDLKDLPKPAPVITSPNSCIRFHGRNARMWYKGDNVTRYDYLYTETELKSFIPLIKHLLQNAHIVQLFFNNHAKAQAVINAKNLEMLLKET